MIHSNNDVYLTNMFICFWIYHMQRGPCFDLISQFYQFVLFFSWFIICKEAHILIGSHNDIYLTNFFFVSGFITCEEARAVIRSYNDVYHLNLSEEVIESAMHNCSNGLHVDYETLVQMLSIAK